MSSPTTPATADARPSSAAAGVGAAAAASSVVRTGPDSSEEELLELGVHVRENRVDDLFDDEPREATHSLPLRFPASAMTTELIRLVNAQLRTKWTLTVLVNGSSSIPTASAAAASVALPVPRPLLPAVPPLPEHAPLSSLWPAGSASLCLCVPSFRPVPRETVVVAVVAPCSTPPHSESLNLRRELYELYVETGDARVATVASLTEQVRRWMHVAPDAPPSALLSVRGVPLRPSLPVRCMSRKKVWFESDRGRLTAEQLAQSSRMEDVLTGRDLNLEQLQRLGNPTEPQEFELPVRPVLQSMLQLCPTLQLPTPLAAQILELLPFGERMLVATRVCRTWRSMVHSPALWTVAHARAWYIACRAEWKDAFNAPLFRSMDDHQALLSFERPVLAQTLREAGLCSGAVLEAKEDHSLF